MEGRGVTNYNVDKPSYGFTTSTTQFDDELMKRDIIQFEQAMMAKGASLEEAQRLTQLRFRPQEQSEQDTQKHHNNNNNTESSIKNDDGGGDDDDDDDSQFLERYRAMRIAELKKKSNSFGQVIPISRPDWNKEVNSDSHQSWVVVTLTSSNTRRTGAVEYAIQELSSKFPSIKFVSIPSQQAIENWPDTNLPSIFVYHKGTCQQQLIQMDTNLSVDQVEWKLAQIIDELDTDLEEEPEPSSPSSSSSASRGYKGTSVFGGQMSQLKTQDKHEEEDYDAVD
eukprot:CAMPEP_0195289430 /NCGR_PEP_ID=MMETSP0707-20130614/5711_1 /TAXON_ID=33640 /ORGANISM="Asterionellopsis glacialis, Strain CCMP134" /LENGTH=280 /DNA_ID=CAMNT_0040349433 /DNA_START=76 /DNA_END=918 /DNA_ORIENTATION=-